MVRYVALCLICLASLPVAAMNGFFLIGHGTRSTGMGGVAQALPQETLVGASNPAGMVWLGSRLDVGGGWLRQGGATALTASPLPDANAAYKSARSILYPEIGVNWMGRSCRAWGISFYLKGVFDAHYSRAIPTEGISPERGRYVQYFLSPSWSVRPFLGQSFGIALNIAFGWVTFNGLENLAANSASPSNLTNRGSDNTWGVGLTFGWMGQFFERLRAGLSYQTRTWMSRAHLYKGFLPERGKIENPSTLAGGIAVLLTPYLIVGFDLGWVFWSDVEGFGNRVNSLNPFGSSGGPGFGWRDSVVAKLGISYALSDCFTVRGGYHYGRSPVIPRAVDNNSLTLAMPEHHLTLGMTWAWRIASVNLAYAHGFTHEIIGLIAPERGGGNRQLRASQDQVTASLSTCF